MAWNTNDKQAMKKVDDVAAQVGVEIDSLTQQLANKANKSPSEWLSATVLNGWTGTVLYRKDDMGNIQLKVNVTAKTTGANIIIATLAVGYHPESYTPLLVRNLSKSTTSVDSLILTDGSIRIGSVATINDMFSINTIYKK